MQNLSGTETLDDTPNDSGSQSVSDVEESATELSYSLKFMNPKKKSEYTIRRWRIKQRFVTVSQLSSKLVENFEELRPVDSSGLSMGYIEPGHGYKGKQRWLCVDEDLCEMYSIYSGRSEILMWCFLPGKKSKRMQQDDHSEGTAKRSRVVEYNSKKVSEVEEIVSKLQSKHGALFTLEQYHAWGQLIQMGKHTSYDVPPQYTFFKSAPNASTSEKSSASTSGSVSTSNTVTSSPGKRVHLRTELFTQLEKLEGLYEKGCVTKEQCDELKKSIMGDIKGL